MEEVPISLYLKLQQGEHADLKVVSQTGIAFANLIEEMARAIDPFSEIRVEIVSGSEGSYDLNTITKVVRDVLSGVQAGLDKRPPLKWLVVYVVFRIVNNGVDWTQDKVMDWLLGSDAPPIVKQMTKAEIRELAGEIVAQMPHDRAKAQSEALYSIVKRDPKIIGIGVIDLALVQRLP